MLLPRVVGSLALVACAGAQAALFDDNEARARINTLSGRVDQIQRSVEQRLATLETAVRNQATVDLVSQLELLRGDIAKLRGQIEVMSHDLEQAQKRQRDLYVDLDSRIRRIELAPRPETSRESSAPASRSSGVISLGNVPPPGESAAPIGGGAPGVSGSAEASARAGARLPGAAAGGVSDSAFSAGGSPGFPGGVQGPGGGSSLAVPGSPIAPGSRAVPGAGAPGASFGPAAADSGAPSAGASPPAARAGSTIATAPPNFGGGAGSALASREPPSAMADVGAEQRAYDSASRLFREGDYVAAVDAFRAFVRNYPGSPLAPSAQYWIGNSQYALRDCRSAIATQRHLLVAYPDSQKVPDSMLNIATCQAELGDRPSARRMLEDIVAAHPSSDAARIARQRLAVLR